jgi:hypothetical protein
VQLESRWLGVNPSGVGNIRAPTEHPLERSVAPTALRGHAAAVLENVPVTRSQGPR